MIEKNKLENFNIKPFITNSLDQELFNAGLSKIQKNSPIQTKKYETPPSADKLSELTRNMASKMDEITRLEKQFLGVVKDAVSSGVTSEIKTRMDTILKTIGLLKDDLSQLSTIYTNTLSAFERHGFQVNTIKNEVTFLANNKTQISSPLTAVLKFQTYLLERSNQVFTSLTEAKNIWFRIAAKDAPIAIASADLMKITSVSGFLASYIAFYPVEDLMATLEHYYKMKRDSEYKNNVVEMLKLVQDAKNTNNNNPPRDRTLVVQNIIDYNRDEPDHKKNLLGHLEEIIKKENEFFAEFQKRDKFTEKYFQDELDAIANIKNFKS